MALALEEIKKHTSLVINSKRRVYYPIKQEGITYQVNGPARTEFISRYPVLRKKKNSHSFNYVIVLNGSDTIEVNHRYKVQGSIRSVQHPKHRYTYSGNYFICLLYTSPSPRDS